MASREKSLRIPAALAVALLAPGLSCSRASGPDAGCGICSYIGVADGGAIRDGGLPDASVGDVVPCTGEGDPHLTDPLWSCTGFV